jgi:AraC-like DNA-binding protein
MYRFLILLFLILGKTLFSQNNVCPQNKNIGTLIAQAISASKSGDSKKTIQLLEEGVSLSRAENCAEGEMICNKNLMLQYGKISDYDKSLDAANKAEKLAKNLNDFLSLAMIYETKATLYDNLGLFQESKNQYELALIQAKKIVDNDQRHFRLAFIYYNLSAYYQDTSLTTSDEYLQKSKGEIVQVKDDSMEVPLSKKKDMIVSIDMNLGLLYNNKKYPKRNIKLSESYFMEALKIVDDYTYNIHGMTKIDLYESLISLYNDKKSFSTAIIFGEKMLELEKKYSMPYNRRSAYMQLTSAYMETGQTKVSQKYLELYSKLNDSIVIEEKKAVEKPVAEIISKNEDHFSKKIQQIIIIASILVIIFVGIWLILWNEKRKKFHKRYVDLISSLKIQKSEFIEEERIEIQQEEHLEKPVLIGIIENKASPSEEPVSIEIKTTSITDKTLASLLAKLEKFEKTNTYTKQNINFPFLVNYLGTNSKYLNEILKQYKNKSFSLYINDLRIDYIIKLLYENPKYREYKISYLAEESGFSSRELFTTTFKKKTGISPSYFIEHLKDSTE